ncbi:PaaX family transcriptional regulator [Kineococcus sp. SYSU DK018]|uniref:PaaX family transcriptional regulator n=1 Tax=Kineococcus sp. SYSU DK018 TaxID=3383139 RepID=UPI003D7D6125
MPTTLEPGRPVAAHPRTLLVEFLGAFVRHHDGWAPVSAMVSLMAEVGLDGPTVRTLVSRLKSRGWLQPEKRAGASGYRLTPTALASLAEGDEVVWRARQEVSLRDGWVLVTFSVPESERAKRHLLRSRLTGLGFGNIGPGVWIAPARMLEPARSLLRRLELERFVDTFTAQVPPGGDVSDLIRRGWDLGGINAEYRAFVEHHEPVVRRWEWPVDPGAAQDHEAFRDYVLTLNAWRQLPFKDPGLPQELLGPDWAGRAAGDLFVRVVELLEDRARAHAARAWPAHGPDGSRVLRHR